MADARSPGGAGETAIGYKCTRLPQANPHERGGRREHFRHAGRALRAFVTNHNHIARFDFAAVNRLLRFAFGVEHSGRPGVFHHRRIDARLFHDAAVRREIAFQDRKTPFRMNRIVQGTDHFLVSIHGFVGNLVQGQAGTGFRFSMQQRPQFLDESRDAAGLFEVPEGMRAGAFQVGDMRRLPAGSLDVIQRDADSHFPGYGRNVDGHVGGSADGRGQDQCVFKTLFV